jgi:hypothetical protein
MANNIPTQSTKKQTSPAPAKVATIKTITVNAMETLADLTGYEASSVVSIKKEGDVWNVILELVEKVGIPDRMDILGRYHTTLDAGGEVINYERVGLRKRGDTGIEVEDEAAE